MDTSMSNVRFIDQTHSTNKSLGVGMYTSLIGTFDFPTLINYLGRTSVGKIICVSTEVSLVYNRIDPWILPSQVEPDVPLSTI